MLIWSKEPSHEDYLNPAAFVDCAAFRDDDVERQAEWMRDPLSHPDIDAMSERELADLPFGRVKTTECCCPA